MPSPSDLSIRRATPGDKRAVLAVVRGVWGGHDYVPAVFDTWVRDRRGGLFVAVVRGRIVGLGKLTMLGEEAWLHGLRVAPRARRRGVARALIAFRLDRARTLGARVARLDTADDNLAVRRLMRRFRFAELFRYGFWRHSRSAGIAPRHARRADLPALMRLAGRHPIDGPPLVRLALTRARLSRSVERGRCLVAGPLTAPKAMALVEPEGGSMRVTFVAGSGTAVVALLAALPVEARRRRLGDVEVVAREIHTSALRRAGYRRPWRLVMILYEKRL